jgi:predicted Abi (CAAX) family protease
MAPGDPSAPALVASINQDLQAALNDQYAKQMVQSNPDIRQWVAHHPG